MTSIQARAVLTAAMLLFLTLPVLCSAEPTQPHMACPEGWSPSDAGVASARAVELELDARIQAALEAVRSTPGLAVGIVDDGQVVYSRGFGAADLESCEPVTPETGFYLLSVTKSFTGMAAALLQEQGTVAIDEPLTAFFPDFEIRGSVNADQISIRDLLNHRAGLRNGAINYRTFVPGDLFGEELLRVLSTHSQPHPITFDYSNTSYIVAAQAIEEVTGIGWRDLIEKKIFEPLGMASSTTSIELARERPFAYPYGLDLEGEYEPVMVKAQAQMHAAGGSVSNVVDLLRWLEANLEGGRIDGRQVLPSRVVRQAHAPQIQYEWRYGRYRRFAYGLGVHNSDVDGELVIHHFGGPIHVSFAPEHRLGLVLLSAGRHSTGFVHGLAASLYDLLLDKPDAVEGLEGALEEARSRLWERLEGRREEAAGFATRRGELARAGASYEGVYRSDRMGDLVVVFREGRLVLEHGVVEIDMEPLEKDTFLIRFPYGASDEMVFESWSPEGPQVLDWGGRIFDRQP